MKNTLIVFVATVAFSGLANADQLCGKLTGYCGNGWCNKTITPTYCLNGPQCSDGQPVKVVAENAEATQELNDLLGRGEGTRVCAEGAKDDAGVFHVSSADGE